MQVSKVSFGTEKQQQQAVKCPAPGMSDAQKGVLLGAGTVGLGASIGTMVTDTFKNMTKTQKAAPIVGLLAGLAVVGTMFYSYFKGDDAAKE